MPASLGGYHYYLYPGQLVYITGHAGGIPRCSVVEDPAQRTSEDYFSVSYEDLEVIEVEPEATPNTMHVFRKQEHEREFVWIYKGEVDVETRQTTFGQLLPSDRVSNYFPEENYWCEEMPEAGGMIASL
jgi:hypothetical protein